MRRMAANKATFCLLMATMSVVVEEAAAAMRQLTLSEKDDFSLYWEYNSTTKSIEFEAVAKRNSGWLGIGFSTTGSMEGADLVVCWVDGTGKPHLHDMNAKSNTMPSMDSSQDYELLSIYQNTTHTSCSFNRSVDTCDSKEDFYITSDTVKLIWALGSMASPGNPAYHSGDRGAVSVYLLDPPTGSTRAWDPSRTFNVTTPTVTVPANATTAYMCSIHKAKVVDKKQHYIGVRPVIQPGNEKRVHHLVVYECNADAPEDLAQLEKAASSKRVKDCYDGDPTTRAWLMCFRMFTAWAVGSKGFMFPSGMGYPISTPTEGPKFYRLEIHYDNPKKETFTDTSGVTMLFTETPRRHDVGLVEIGLTYGPLQIIPPGQKSFVSVGFCSVDCTRAGLPRDGINVIGSMLHSHLLGRKMKLRHFRNGTELSWLEDDDHYDFNYQETRLRRRSRRIIKGDSLALECTYDSTGRTGVSIGGLKTEDEMCMAYVYYWPRMDMSSCVSNFDYEEVGKMVGLDPQIRMAAIPRYDMDFKIDMTKTAFTEFLNKRYSPWNATTVQMFTDLAKGTKPQQFGLCIAKGRVPVPGTEAPARAGYPPDLKVYKPKERNCSAPAA